MDNYESKAYAKNFSSMYEFKLVVIRVNEVAQSWNSCGNPMGSDYNTTYGDYDIILSELNKHLTHADKFLELLFEDCNVEMKEN